MTEDGLFLRPDLPRSRRRAQGLSRMGAAHRAAVRSVLDETEHGGRFRGDARANQRRGQAMS
ncbi:MAG: hypothetical protein B7Z58_08940 [Acidiphilium sp. 37-64-53]|nr:MAG: hypothetical protein B7Z58_08940 [Acidiphilium sp. 37-64-53]